MRPSSPILSGSQLRQLLISPPHSSGANAHATFVDPITKRGFSMHLKTGQTRIFLSILISATWIALVGCNSGGDKQSASDYSMDQASDDRAKPTENGTARPVEAPGSFDAQATTSPTFAIESLPSPQTEIIGDSRPSDTQFAQSKFATSRAQNKIAPPVIAPSLPGHQMQSRSQLGGFVSQPTIAPDSIPLLISEEMPPGELDSRQPNLLDNPLPKIETRANLSQQTISLGTDDNESGNSQVEVFYVTDRESIAAIADGDFLKNFKWPIIVLVIAMMFGFWSVTQRRLIPGMVAAIIMLAGVSTGYSSLIQWQRLNRLAVNDDVRYSSELKKADPYDDPLDYGRCLVNIPPDHRVGFIDSPSLQRFEFSEDPEKHVILERVIRGNREEFFRDFNQRLNSGTGDTFVFIHGYNVSFENAIKRTAQVSFDLKFRGIPICYSWPSHGGLEDYTRDMANADWTVVHLQEFLTSLFDQTDAKRIHLIAHSMGNRALMQALDRLALQWDRDRIDNSTLSGGSESHGGNSIHRLLQRDKMPIFGQIILAAPDISADEFRQRYAETLRKLSNQITLYASSRDRALMVSTSVHGHNRAGLAGDEICVVDGIDTIDVSHVDTSLIGHSYYGDNPALINDLRALIQLSQPTSKRQWLERVEIAADKVYWKFR